MKVTDISEKTIHKAHCDWIKDKANEIKALLQCDIETILLNKQRALSSIETSMSSLEELRLYIEEVCQ